VRHVPQTEGPPNIAGHPLVAVCSRTSVRQWRHDFFRGFEKYKKLYQLLPSSLCRFPSLWGGLMLFGNTH
jgi:hypothetical protein